MQIISCTFMRLYYLIQTLLNWILLDFHWLEVVNCGHKGMERVIGIKV